MFFPSPFTWKMMKDAPSHIMTNMIGYAHIYLKILEDRYILILPVILFTLNRMVLMTGPKSGSKYPPSAWRLIKYTYDRIFSASV